MSIYVFLGPTLPANEARNELDAVYLPPAAQGDVYRVARHRPEAIGVVDGYFERVPAVWHKEILWALCQGIHVYGSASMGALRAAELASFGMIGVGSVFEAFRDGTLEDDDDVAIIHGPADYGFPRLSEALVNIRHTVFTAVAERVIDVDTGKVLVQLAKSRFYPQRTYANLFRDACAAALPAVQLQAFQDWLPTGQIDQKRLDALAMLRQIRLDVSGRRDAKQVQYHFEYTYHWDRCWRTAEASAPDGPETPTLWQGLLNELCLVGGGWTRARTGALVRLLAARESHRQGVEISTEQIHATAEHFRRSRGLHTPGALERWLQENDLTQDQFLRLLDDEARIAAMERLVHPEFQPRLVDHLRCTGEYKSLSERERDKRQVIAASGVDRSHLESVELTDEELLGWYCRERLGIPTPDDIDAQARTLGFVNARDLRRAVFDEWVYLRAKDRQITLAGTDPGVAQRGGSPLALGDPAPMFSLSSPTRGSVSLDRLSGAPTLLVFSRPVLQSQELDRLKVLSHEHGLRVVFILSGLGIGAYSSDWSLTLVDGDGVVHRRYGISDPGAVLLDGAHRIVAVLPSTVPKELPERVRPLLASLADQEADLRAPVLIIPEVISRETCAALIDRWRGGDTTPFHGSGGSRNSAHEVVTRRVDHWLTPGTLASAVDESIAKRVAPELQRAFYFHVDHVEQYRIGCYPATAKEAFRAHRDNTSAETRSRRYSLSISLNEDYTGGNLRFPEYGRQEYRSRSGWALVFSSSLVHEVSAVTSGVRFALITHFRCERA